MDDQCKRAEKSEVKRRLSVFAPRELGPMGCSDKEKRTVARRPTRAASTERLQRVENRIKFAQGISSSSVIGRLPQVSCDCQTSSDSLEAKTPARRHGSIACRQRPGIHASGKAIRHKMTPVA
jgi:hypothetical protein